MIRPGQGRGHQDLTGDSCNGLIVTGPHCSQYTSVDWSSVHLTFSLSMQQPQQQMQMHMGSPVGQSHGLQPGVLRFFLWRGCGLKNTDWFKPMVRAAAKHSRRYWHTCGITTVGEVQEVLLNFITLYG